MKKNEKYNRFEINIADRIFSQNMPIPHSHNFYEMFLVISGECKLLINDNIHNIVPYSFYIIEPDTIHQSIYPDSLVTKRLNIEFSPNYIENIVSHFGRATLTDSIINQHIYLPDFCKDELLSLIEGIISEKEKNDIYSSYVMQSKFNELLVLLMRNKTAFFDSVTGGMTIQDNSIKKALLYIENNYQRSITLDDIANLSKLNPSYFSTKFKEVTGKHFKDYLTMVRISRSEKYLLETDKSITEIAFLCGFNNYNYYGDVFKKVNKVSPSEFRKLKGHIFM